MGGFSGPFIQSRNALKMHFDPADAGSIISGSTTAIDLSGNLNSGSLNDGKVGENNTGGTNPIFGVDGSPVVHDIFTYGFKTPISRFKNSFN